MSASVILDSISPHGHRLTTMEVTFHRFVLAEFNTHRAFSRNSASSRAIPVEKQLARVEGEPAYPIEWPCEQAGMQGGTELDFPDLLDAFALFDDVRDHTLTKIREYIECHPNKSTRLHKSLINRLIEPFMWHTVIVTSTEWENFFGLRCNPLAQPEIRVAAEAMRDVYRLSVPKPMSYGEWHTPYIRDDEDFDLETRKKVSAARCARVSYLTHDGVRDPDKDLELFERLTSADPKHSSPLEHVAMPSRLDLTLGNFTGWVQFRHQDEYALTAE